MINEQQAARLEESAGRSKKHRQDTKIPFVVNVNDGHLMPNNAILRAHKNYRVYQGPTGKGVTDKDRLKWLEGVVKKPQVVNSKEAEDTFDVGTATADDMAMFALEQWGMQLDISQPLKVLRKIVVEAAEKAAKADASADEESLV